VKGERGVGVDAERQRAKGNGPLVVAVSRRLTYSPASVVERKSRVVRQLMVPLLVTRRNSTSGGYSRSGSRCGKGRGDGV
jgi:hypothetical protein